jgi:hypothetical protein
MCVHVVEFKITRKPELELEQKKNLKRDGIFLRQRLFRNSHLSMFLQKTSTLAKNGAMSATKL